LGENRLLLAERLDPPRRTDWLQKDFCVERAFLWFHGNCHKEYGTTSEINIQH
jgi:hypothetical protein